MSTKAKRVPMKPTRMWAVVDNETGEVRGAHPDRWMAQFWFSDLPGDEHIERVEVRPVQRKGAK